MNWKQAFALGLIATGAWDGKGEPVAYLYGPDKVRLPKLPDRDETVYPYAYISENYIFEPINLGGYTQVCFTSKPCIFDRENIQLKPVDGTTINFVKYGFNRYKESEWGGKTSMNDNTVVNVYHIPVWSNYTVDDLDGNVILAASDPIPVYE